MKTPTEITQSLLDKSKDFLNKPVLEIYIGGILAGSFVSFAAVTSTIVSCDMQNYFGIGFTKLIMGIVFSLGLILIVLSGSELFTGSNLYLIGILDDRKNITLLVKRWALVYMANFVGSILILGLVIKSGVITSDILMRSFINTALVKVNLTWDQAFCRGILCNFMVCLAVRVGESSEEVIGKIFGFIYVISAFVINSFEHSIANMFFIPAGIYFAKIQGLKLTWSDFVFKNLIPVTLGNIIGGALFVGITYYIMHKGYLTSTSNQKIVRHKTSQN